MFYEYFKTFWNLQNTHSPSPYLPDKVIVTLTILQGKDLVAMDRNGEL